MKKDYKILVVGDVHATPDELGDCDKLMELVKATADKEEVEEIVFLGDLHHTFALTNVKVIGFYREWFKELCKEYRVIALVGNHDMPGNGNPYPHALLAYEDLLTIVDEPMIHRDALYLPFYADPNLFHRAVDKDASGVKMIYCHQEFNGAQYDNGFFAPNGADPKRMPRPTISGHIHTPQVIDAAYPIHYLGAPRWRILSDANISRNIHVVTNHHIIKQIPVEVCKRIWAYKYVENEPEPIVPVSPNAVDDFRFYVEGEAAYVKEKVAFIRAKYPAPRISTNVKNKTIRVRESDGIDVAFRKYATTFRGKNATPPEILLEKATKLVYEAQYR